MVHINAELRHRVLLAERDGILGGLLGNGDNDPPQPSQSSQSSNPTNSASSPLSSSTGNTQSGGLGGGLGGVLSQLSIPLTPSTSSAVSSSSSSFSSSSPSSISTISTSTTSSSSATSSTSSSNVVNTPPPVTSPTNVQSTTSTLTPTSTPTVIFSTSGDTVVTLTSYIPPTTSLAAPSSTPESFFQNKPLEGSIFGLAGLVGLVILIGLSTAALRRRRKSKLDKEVFEASSAPPGGYNRFEGEDEIGFLGRNNGTSSAGGGLDNFGEPRERRISGSDHSHESSSSMLKSPTFSSNGVPAIPVPTFYPSSDDYSPYPPPPPVAYPNLTPRYGPTTYQQPAYASAGANGLPGNYGNIAPAVSQSDYGYGVSQPRRLSQPRSPIPQSLVPGGIGTNVNSNYSSGPDMRGPITSLTIPSYGSENASQTSPGAANNRLPVTRNLTPTSPHSTQLPPGLVPQSSAGDLTRRVTSSSTGRSLLPATSPLPDYFGDGENRASDTAVRDDRDFTGPRALKITNV